MSRFLTNFVIYNPVYLRYLSDSDEEFNIIVLGWSPLAAANGGLFSLIYYPQAVANVGKHLANFLNFLVQAGALKNLDDVHVLGFSLGAQIASVAGNQTQAQFQNMIRRITGFDPAGPGFMTVNGPTVERLDYQDAKFVDVIHTNAGILGTVLSSGHVDFYPNGGQKQPICGLGNWRYLVQQYKLY